MVIIATRIIYSISKKIENPSEFYETIARAVLGNMEELTYENAPGEASLGGQDEQDEIDKYLALLE